jgi:hypothetical protein
MSIEAKKNWNDLNDKAEEYFGEDKWDIDDSNVSDFAMIKVV